MAASQSGNAPILLPSSNCIPILVGQFPEKFMSGSLFCSQDPPEILGPANEYCPKPDVVGRGESNFCVDNSTEKQLQRDKDPAMVISSGDGAHQHPIGSWNKESCFVANITMQDFINQDLDDLPEQELESVVQSSAPPASVMPSTEHMKLSPPVGKCATSEDRSSSHSETVLGDQNLVENRLRQLDILNKIIKNIDLEELQELGSGTFGTVYYGKWRGSDVAIKRINNRCFAGKSAEEEKMRDDFWNEASKLADLHHPNVLAFYGVVLDGPGGSFATVTEYMINGSLRNALHQNDRSIVHFDLKSDNLLVNLRDPQRPICKVGDLGLSKVKCQTLISGGVRGTLPWMAPELLNGSSNLVSEKVDVFSFGIVMWEILTGHEPYSGSTLWNDHRWDCEQHAQARCPSLAIRNGEP
ncbi:hypothetical protein HPP92_019659 [Vanilla planifolia]|uniref:Protein kinase domain-containing protein n=1 Tax=Vanilla planifolia TaxID=51239 RepID=A0A835Q766_VANPL|nr:hypothetical protein HPP92_019659 [Vanilla planifolia]